MKYNACIYHVYRYVYRRYKCSKFGYWIRCDKLEFVMKLGISFKQSMCVLNIIKSR